MKHLDLSDDDVTVLREALVLYLNDFRREVARTENSDFRHGLQRKQDVLEHVLTELDQRAA